MIKICDLNTIYIQYEKLYVNSELQKDYIDYLTRETVDVDKILFIITKDGRIAAAASYKDICNNNILYKVFPVCENVFEQVSDYIHSNKLSDGALFPVLDEKDRLLFPVIYVENIVLGQKRTDFWDYADRIADRRGLDYTLLNKFNKFIFVSSDEYSIAIAKVLHQNNKDKKIVFLDKRSKYFLGKVQFRSLPMRGIAEKYFDILCHWIGGRKMGFGDRLISFVLYTTLKRLEKSGEYIFITSNKSHYWPIDSIYNSASVMYSLLWCKEKKRFGDRNRDKTIYLLDYACHNEGLVSIIRWTLAHIKWIAKRGGILSSISISSPINI